MNVGDKVYVLGEVVSDIRGEGLESTYQMVLFNGTKHPVPVSTQSIRPFLNAVRERELDMVTRSPSFHRNMRKYRVERNITQRDLAAYCGVTQGAIWQWENGATVPRLHTFVKLCEALGVQPADLMKEETK